MKPAIVILSETALPLARRIADAIGGDVHGYRQRTAQGDVSFDDPAAHLRRLYKETECIVAIMATGALMRILAPVIGPKQSDPPVIAVSEDGASVVPLLGGHYGANLLAREIAELTGGHAAVTTAGDTRFGIALDSPPAGWRLVNPGNAKAVMAELVAGAAARLEGDLPWLSQSRLSFSEDGTVRLTVSEKAQACGPLDLHFAPRTVMLGMGCERGADAAEAIALCDAVLAERGLVREAVAGVFSLDLKADEAAVHAVAAHLGVPARFFDAATLESETPRLANPSDIVFAEVGCHGVAEGAALAAAGPDGDLVAPKVKTKRVTMALARAPQPVADLPGRARGRLFVVGIGPGSEGWRSPEASLYVEVATDLVGYSLYLDLLGPLARGKMRHDYDLGAEELRVRRAMELAGEGRDVALVCSGDAGIYAMATLVFELLDKGDLPDAARRIAIEVSPGISALQAAAARAGAPLGHDFCTISLSDLLTPWEMIQRRVKAAAEGDFVIAFYNPVSKKRRTQLAFARDVLLEYRPATTPVILATNLGREGERVRIVELGALDVDEVDMLTVVVVGSSQSRVVETGEGRRFTYTPRGYAAKDGSAMKKDA
ncbi:MAG: precorrin-3B C(17)-methyltransferase, partial [Brucellaceae bacterium]|nr:precorrin-3B C(17)-methyltransferase [Brucellaceae bacterium]